MNRKNRQQNEKFVRGVLSRTSGSPCQRACEQLPDLAGGNLVDLDRQLVQAHLEHCPGCRSVAVVLGWMQPMLPEMAELDPGPDFTRRVISRTTGAVHPLERAARQGETVGPLALVDRLGRWWQKQLFRPRFAMEVAYVATVLLVLLTSAPGAPLAGKAHRTGEMIQAGPRALPFVGSYLVLGQEKIATYSTAKEKRFLAQWQEIQNQFELRHTRSERSIETISLHLKQAWQHGRSGQLNMAGYQIKEAALSTRLAWVLYWQGKENEHSNDGQS